MTKERACANEEGLPALMDHIQRMSGIAARLCFLTDAAMAVSDDPESAAVMHAMLDRSCKMANDLNLGLDKFSLPKVQQ